MPGIFPLNEDKPFLSESEWVILKLLCRPVDALAEADAEELSAACNGQISIKRCRDLIGISRISRLPGLGTWIARFMVEAGLDADMVSSLPAAEIVSRINARARYPICNAATERALAGLQEEWRSTMRGAA